MCGQVLPECGEGALEFDNMSMIEDRRPIGPLTGASVARNRDRQVVVRGVLGFPPLQDPDGQPDAPAAQFRRASQGTRIV